ncbi:MAG: SDR family oxidoreductase [Anaerolineales bacterium]|nr:SDR family oxidoreductase [Anaerolineales bacterium]
MAYYLVTGGAGFIGSHLVAELVARGERVRVLDNFSTGRQANLEPYLSRIEVMEGDIRSYHLVRQAAAGMDYVLHQAALPSASRSVRDPLTSNEVNVTGTLNVLQAALEGQVKRLIFASSASVYGDTPALPQHESMAPRPRSPYAISKLAAEQYCQGFWQLYGLETVALRYFSVFGPRQEPVSQYAAVIPKFITALLAEERPVIFGDGSQSRDFTFVGNVVQANLKACTAPAAVGGVFNIACGQRTSLLDLVAHLTRLTHRRADVLHTAPRPGDVAHAQADISLARSHLGYEPQHSLAEGLRRTLEWYRPPPPTGVS